MAVEPKSILKTHFETGKVPTEQQFSSLIDSLAHVDDVPTDADLSAHTSNVSNPHSVTKSQVGLSAVDNTSDANKPVSTAQQAAINAHATSTTNPHSVTKAQVGLANADNTSDTAKPVSTAQQAAINAHANRVDNPHSVTKTQVGLGNVNNTADTAKPVSTAQQAAIDAHANRTDNPHNVTAAQIGLNATESFNNIADMKAASLTDGQLTHTEGYASSGDDGGNLYIYHSTGRPGSQDGGFVIFGNGASDWFEAWDTTVANVRKFGAKGDGVTDDITAINNAISAATTQVTFPYGTYNVSAKITVNTQHHITGYGAIITPTVAMDSVMEILADDCTVTGLTLDLDGDAVPVTTERGEGMRIYGNRCTARDIIIRECPVGGFANGFYLALGRGIHLVDCHVYDAGYAAYRCDAPQATITNCNAIYTRQRAGAKYRWVQGNGPIETFVYNGGQWEFFSGFTSDAGGEGCVFDHESQTSEPNITLENITIYTPLAIWDAVSTTIKIEAVTKVLLRNIDASGTDAPYSFRPSLNHIGMEQCVMDGCHFLGQISVTDPTLNDLREFTIKHSVFALPTGTDLIRNVDRVKLLRLQNVRIEGDWRGLIGPSSTTYADDSRFIIDDVECVYGGSSDRYLFGFAPTDQPIIVIRGLKIDEGIGQVYLGQTGDKRIMFSGDDKTLYYDFPLSMYYRGGTGTCGVAASPPSASNNQIQAAASGDAFPGITGLEPGTRILNMNPANGDAPSWIYDGTVWTPQEGNIANADLTFTADRTHDMDNNDLNFINAQKVTFTDASPTASFELTHLLRVGGPSVAQSGSITFYDDDNSHYAGFIGPHVGISSWQALLPDAQPANVDDYLSVVSGEGTSLPVLRWKAAGKIFNVKDYGAVGDNTADDTAAIQAAATAQSANGGIVYVPKGVYRVTSTIDFGDNSVVRGEGRVWSDFRTEITDGSPALRFGVSADVQGIKINSNLAIASVPTSAGTAGYCIGLRMGTFDTGVTDPSTRSRTEEVEVNGCFIGIEANGWLCRHKLIANNCHTGLRASYQNGSTIDFWGENNAKHFEVTNSQALTFHQLATESAGSFLAITTRGASTINSSRDVTIENWYSEEDQARDHVLLSIGGSSECNNVKIRSGYSTGDTQTTNGVPMIDVIDCKGGEVSGYFEGSVRNNHGVRIGAGGEAIRVIDFNSNETLGSQVYFAPAKVLATTSTCVNPLPRFEHKGGHFSNTEVKDCNQSWVASSIFPGTYALRLDSNGTSVSQDAKVRLEIRDQTYLALLDNQPEITFAAVVRIGDSADFEGATDDLTSSPIAPQCQLRILDGSEVSIAGDINTSFQIHRRNTIQIYSAQGSMTGITGARGLLFDLWLGGFGGTSNDWTVYTTAYIEIEAIYVMLGGVRVNVPYVANSLVEPTVMANSNMVGGKLVTAIDATQDASHIADYDVGDKIVLSNGEKVCNIAGSTTVANFITHARGTGTPEGAVVGRIGSTFERTDGGAGTSFYIKESGTGNTGWVAK